MFELLKRLFSSQKSAPRGPEQSKADTLMGTIGKSEEHFSQLVANVRDYAVILLDPQGNIRTWNSGAERIKGYRAEEIIGESFKRFYPKEAVSAGWPTHELEVAASTGRFEDEGWRLRKDGSRFWASVVITSLREAHDRLSGFLKITRDLTDRKQSEEKLRISEERFRLMVDGVTDYAIYMLDPAGRVATWNAGAERLKQYAAEEIIGEHFSRFYSAEQVEQGWPEEELRRAIADGRFEDEGWRYRKDGTKFWANVVITALRDQSGALRGFGKVTRDLTQRREREDAARELERQEMARINAEAAAVELDRQREQLQVTLASIGDAVIVTDENGIVTFINDVAAEITKWPLKDAQGQSLDSVFPIVHEDTRQPVENPITKAFRERSIVLLANHTALINRDGVDIPIEDSAAPIWDKDGKISGAVLVFRDVSERRRQEILLLERSKLVALRADVSSTLASSRPTPDVLQGCCASLVEHLDAAFARIWTVDNAGAVLELQASAGLYTHLDGPHSRVPIGQYKIGRIASNRLPHLTNSVRTDPEVSDHTWATATGMVAFAGFPLLVDDKLVGVLAMFARHELSDAVLKDLAPLAEGIAQLIIRRRVEADLSRQSELYRTTLISIGDAVITTDAGSRVAMMNPIAESLTGWKMSDAVGHALAEVFKIVNEDSRQTVSNPVERAMRDNVIVGLANHTILLAKGGREIAIDDSAAPIHNSDGEIIGGVLVFRDITERKQAEISLRQSEEFNRSVMDNSGDCIKVLDIDGRLLHMNQPGLCSMEISDFGVVCGQEWERLWPADASGEIRKSLDLARRGQSFSFQAFCPTAKGTPRWWDVSVSPMRDPADGSVIQILSVSRDITERKRTSEVAQRILASISDGMITVDREWRITEINPRAEELISVLGLTRDEAIGRDFFEAIPSLRGTVYETNYLKAVRDQVTVTFEAQYEPLGIWVDVRAYPSSEGLAIYFLDITERKRLESQRHQFVSMAEMSQDFVGMADVNQIPFFINEAGRRMVGLTPERVSQVKVIDFFFPEDQQWVKTEIVPQVMREGHADVDIRFRNFTTGEPVWVTWSVFQLRDSDGKQAGIATVSRDITERRDSEQRLRSSELARRLALDAADLGMWNIDSKNRLVTDERFRQIWHGSTAPLEYEQAFDSIHPEDRQRIRNSVTAATHPEQPVPYSEEFRVVHPDGSTYWVLSQGRANFEQAGSQSVMTSFDGTVSNITARKTMENHLRQLAANLSEADHRKNEFLATLAHELRNPLAPMRNGLQLIRLAGPDISRIDEARSMMERQLVQMVRLVDDLLDVSRISQGKLQLRKETVDLAAVINSAVETSRTLIAEMHHELFIELPDEPVLLQGDFIRLAQVFTNLLNNSAKYSQQGGRIRLGVNRFEDKVLISVKDEGVGIAPDQLPRIFDLFTQIDQSLSKSQGGLGIGLSLVKQLVELHGGTIEAHSEGNGTGSEFIVTLDLNRTTSAIKEVSNELVGVRKTLKILVVDDNRDSANSLAMMLKLLGTETRAAYDGEEAIAVANEMRPDVILLDIGLPKLSGHEVCIKIRQQPWAKKCLIVAQTGWGQEEDKLQTTSSGFDRHMVKPIDTVELMKLLSDR